jgi:hypothetical protein
MGRFDCIWRHAYHAAEILMMQSLKWKFEFTGPKRSPFSCFITENFIWIEPLLRGHLSYKATFTLSQRRPLNTGLTVHACTEIKKTYWKNEIHRNRFIITFKFNNTCVIEHNLHNNGQFDQNHVMIWSQINFTTTVYKINHNSCHN